MKDRINVALIRGNSLNNWEGGLWNGLEDRINVQGVCTKKNLYDVSGLSYPIQKLSSPDDTRLWRAYNMYHKGVIQRMSGLSGVCSSADIVHTAELQYDYTREVVRAKKQYPNLKVVVTVWDNLFGRFETMTSPWGSHMSRTWKKRMYAHIQEVVRGADYFLPVSHSAAALAKSFGVPEKKMSILQPAVTAVFENVEESNIVATVKDRVGKSIDVSKSFLMVNRLVEEKGVHDVLYAWELFIQQHPEYTLLILGKGPEEARLKAITLERGLGESVFFIGSLPNNDVKQLYRHVRAFVLASVPTKTWQEQFGYVLAEAITNGCPVISTYSGAIPEVVGDAGILVPPGAPWELVRALEAMATDDVYMAYKKKVKEAKDRFSVSVFHDNLLEVYTNILK